MRKLKALLFLAVFAAVVAALGQIRAPQSTLAARSGPGLAEARAWGYQLQLAAPERVAAAIDVMVVDYARGVRPTDTLSREDVARFQTRPDGSKRIVLAYLSIGEAESYRYYWWSHWRFLPPSWLAHENKEWQSNFHVRYWEPAWRDIIFKARHTALDRVLDGIYSAHRPYLDRILDAGFDGVYLDRVDAFYEWGKTRPSAELDMAAFVVDLAAYAKARRRDFLIVPQNGEELLEHDHYRRSIDAIAKEDLFFGVDGAERANQSDEVSRSIELLDRAKGDGLPVFVVEYLSNAGKRATAARRAADLNYQIHFAARALNQAPELQLAPKQAAPPPASWPPLPVKPANR